MIKNKTLKIAFICVIILAVLFAGCAIILAEKMKTKEEDSAKQEETQEVSVTATPEGTPEATTTTTDEVAQATPEVTEALNIVDDFEEADDHIYINGDEVNLRIKPSQDADVVATVKKGEYIKRIGFAEEWSKLLYNNHECYVSNSLITEETPEGMTDGVDDPDHATSGGAVASSGGKVVIIDPGHQGKGDSTQEPIGPGASQTKARVTSGTTGRVSGWAEYELNLDVSLKLRDELVRRGYTVYMTRDTHDINISNMERAKFASDHNGDILVRIHANGSDDSSVNGALCMAPTTSNQFLSADLINESRRLSSCIINSYVAATGFNNQGVYSTDEMSGINWSAMPVTIVEMGYMSNASDDAKMADAAMQVNMVKGMSDGIDNYFAGGQ